MRTVTIIAGLALAACSAETPPPEPVAAAEVPAASVPYETGSLDGEWQPSAMIVSGASVPDAMREAMTLVIDGDSYRVISGEEIDRGALDIDSIAQPPRMTVTSANGRSLKAIYRFEEGDLIVAYDLQGEQFPTAFESGVGSQQMLARYHRAP